MRARTCFLLSLLLAAGCAQQTELKPAPTAQAVPGEERGAVETVAGVQVRVRPEMWPGPAPLKETVVPARVVIENDSGQPVRIAYREFALVGSGGQVYAALPPFAVSGTVSELALNGGYDPILNPRFTATGFTVAPFYSPVYPGYPVASGPFYADPQYYGTYGDYWRRYDLPTEAMLERALPEGELADGGDASGFLYFEQIEGDPQRVVFRMDLVNADTGAALGTLSIPFRVQET